MENVTKIIEQVAEEICDKLCRYNETCDDNCECDYMREKGDCPLDRLL